MKRILVLLTVAATAFGTHLSADENITYQQTEDQLLAQNGYDPEYTYSAPGAATDAAVRLTPFLIGIAALAAIAGIIVAATDSSSSTSHSHS